MSDGSDSSGMSCDRINAAAPAMASTPTTATWSHSSKVTRRGRRRIGSAEAARIAPPKGRLRTPAICTTPLADTMTPGVARAWITSMVAMVEKAMPSHSARPSFRRAATTDITADAATASAPATPTTIMWTIGGNIIMRIEVTTSTAAGITAARTSTATTGSRGRS